MALLGTATSISAAIDDVQQDITVASTTGMAKNTVLNINGELLEVLKDPVTSTQLHVARGVQGSRAQAHGNGSMVSWATQANESQAFSLKGFLYNTGALTYFSPQGFYPTTYPQTVNTATAVTLTPGQLLAGIILQDPNGGGVTTTLPTAADLVAAIPGATVGTTFRVWIKNTADAGETITVSAGTGGTVSGTATIAQNYGKEFLFRLDEVFSGSEAYTAYSLGSVAF